MKLLLTGFGPFGSVVDNPTEKLARHFHGARIGDREVFGLPLPTSFARATALLHQHLDGHDRTLMLGVAESAETLRIETVGINFDDARIPDVDGHKPVGPIRQEGPDALPVTCDVVQIASAWERAGIRFDLSTSAGAYVCNHTLYRVLSAGARAGFIHVPLVSYRELIPAIELAISVA